MPSTAFLPPKSFAATTRLAGFDGELHLGFAGRRIETLMVAKIDAVRR